MPSRRTLSTVGFVPVLLLFEVFFLCSTDDVTQKCEVECDGVKLKFAEISSEGNGCNVTCRMEQCSHGCKLWGKSSNSSCTDSCGNLTQKNIGVDICGQSCARAIRIYINETTKQFKNLPGLVFVSSSNVSVMLRWSITPPEPRFSLRYLLQKLILGFSNDWLFHDSVEWLAGQRINVFDLKPYVTYKFRIVVVTADDIVEPLPESLPIATEPSGTPLQAPEVVSLSTTSTSVHLKAKPPFFVNGPLIGFKLTVSRSKRYSDARIKEIVTHGNTGSISEVITMLQPDTEYELRLAAFNRFGIGPELLKTVRTRSQNQVQTIGHLLVCADNRLLKQDLSDIFGDPDILFEDSDEAAILTDIAIHYAQQLIFVATSSRHIHRISINENTRTTHNMSLSVAALTVDWLHDILYVASADLILECNLNVDSCLVAVHVDNATIVDMHVDPCNGYLYWTQKGFKSGLFSLDLDGVKTFSFKPNAIVVGTEDAFAVDYTNYRLFYSNETVQSIISVYLDGTDPVDIRTNTQNPDFSWITGLAYYRANYTFYWTDGKRLMMEAYDNDNDLYHHNQMPNDARHFGAVEVWGTGAQPIPVPILPPRNLQALFTQTSAFVSWLPPESDQGRGAWQQWLYEVEVMNVDAGTNRSLPKINLTWIRIENLVPGALYSFRVCGTSAGGSGPWSEYFMAHVLTSENSLTHTLLYASAGGVFEKTLDGWNTRLAVNSNVTSEAITELSSYFGRIYLATRSGKLYTKSKQQSELQALEVNDVGVLAFDWLTDQLYWSNTKLNLIKRMPLKEVISVPQSANREEIIVYASSIVHDLVLDVLEARMYWATSSTIEIAYLDGQDHRVVQKLPSFSSQNVLGMAVDSRSHLLFWMVKNVVKLVIYRTRLADLDGGANFWFVVERVDEFPGRVMHPSLDFLSNKLFWIGSKNTVSVFDLRSRSIAQLPLASENETQIVTFDIVPNFDTEAAVFLNDTTNPHVIPDVLDSNSMFIAEFDNYVNISWKPYAVTLGRVYYRVWIRLDGYHRQEKQTTSSFVVQKDLRFYSEIEVSLAACSYWGCGPKVQKIFHSLLAEKSVQGQLTFALSTSLGVIMAVTMTVICVLFIICLGRKSRKTIFSIFDSSPSARSSDHELATLTHLPASALETTNVLYSGSFLPGNEEISSLPHFPHDQLLLTKFLGSGAFGKVFEGIAVNILSEFSGEMKVAVKTLHKSASDIERKEFLKEALLMNNFKHDHILRLLGVCLNHKPQLLILELMDGGDLLTFLRASRPSFVTGVKLTTLDMTSICTDVGKGCQYLEEMHFVHRDLAARNCLISFSGSSLVVKIGDFGLARDIYRNDYYKKEGEGLLPIRWMAPESLIDGIFTTQSDVWAYGVLMWEVVTLGQQPYPVQTNLEVLHFVRSGGRLDCPENCPNDLYQLMSKCWQHLPLIRPSFQDIVRQLKTLSRPKMAASATPASNISPFPEYDRPSGRRCPQLHGQAKSWMCSEDRDSSSSSGHFADQRELTIFDPISPNTRVSKHGPVRSGEASNVCCDGRTCGYLQPSHQQRDKHPKYLELVDSTSSSQGST